MTTKVHTIKFDTRLLLGKHKLDALEVLDSDDDALADVTDTKTSRASSFCFLE